MVQYFNDRHCDLYLGSSSLADEQNVCSAQTSSGGEELNGYQQLTCSTSASPELFANSVTSGCVFYSYCISFISHTTPHHAHHHHHHRLYLNTKCTGTPFGYVNYNPTKCNVLNMGDGDAPYYFQYTCPSGECRVENKPVIS